jgi:hypothetical protein
MSFHSWTPTSWKLLARGALSATALAAGAACAQILSFKDLTQAASDGGAPGKVLYVDARQGNPQADRDRDGKTGKTALASIKNAIARHATDPALADYEIHVCAGEYQEGGIEITSNVVLRGGYDCTSWERSKAFGHPNFDAATETKLMPPTVMGPTLTVRGADVTRATLIEGFTVLGASGRAVTIDTAETSAISFDAGAAPVFAQSTVKGGRLLGTVRGRIAGPIAMLSVKARPLLQRVAAVGGDLASDVTVGLFGSAGLAVEGDFSNRTSSNSLVVDNCTIRGRRFQKDENTDAGVGNTAPAPLGAGGIVARNAAMLQIVGDSTISGGGADGTLYATVGLYLIAGSTALVERSSIDGGDGGGCRPAPTAMGPCSRYGIVAQDDSELVLRASVVHGGEVVPDGATIGILGLRSKVFAVNSVIHGGGRLVQTSIAGVSSSAVVIEGGARTFPASPTQESGFYANTLILGLTRKAFLSRAISYLPPLTPEAHGWAFVGNLIVGNDYSNRPDLTQHDAKNSFGILTYDCADPNLRVQYNIFLDVRNEWGAFSCVSGAYQSKTLSDFQTNADITGDAGASKREANMRYAADCPDAGDPLCESCGGATCAPQLIKNFDEVTGTFPLSAGFFAPNAAAKYCPLFRAGGPLADAGADAGAVVSVDKEGKPRTDPLTPGAFEVDCVP